MFVFLGCGGGGGGGGGGISSSTYSGTVSFAWHPPDENTDGTPLTDLTGYKIYYGTSPNNYTYSIDLGYTTVATIEVLSEGMSCFAFTAYNSLGNESNYSSEICTTI